MSNRQKSLAQQVIDDARAQLLAAPGAEWRQQLALVRTICEHIPLVKVAGGPRSLNPHPVVDIAGLRG